jgi:hypothetical protein
MVQLLAKLLALYPVWKYYRALAVLDQEQIQSDFALERTDLFNLLDDSEPAPVVDW